MQPGKFGFIVHPTNLAKNLAEIHRHYPVTRLLPDAWIEALTARLPARLVAHVTGIETPYNRAEGWFTAVVLTARQMLRLPERFVIDKIVAAARLAERQGARVIGLGAYTAIVGDGGREIARRCSAAITTGNSLTVAAALEGARQGAARMGIDPEQAEFAVVGATGSIGSACARILARQHRRLTLIGRDVERLQGLARAIAAEGGVAPGISTDIAAALPRADVVIAVSSAADAIIEPEHLKPGAVVCDVALPRDVDERVGKVRDDVLIIDGGIIRLPGRPEFNLDFGAPPGHSLACMAETILLALENRYEPFTLGRDVSVEQVDEITRLARKHGFEVAGIRSFHRAVDETAFARIRQNADRRRARLRSQVGMARP